MKILVTGSAGFIGFHVAQSLLKRGDEVVGLDNINDYYDMNLKYARLTEIGIKKESVEQGKIVQSTRFPLYRFIKLNIEDREELPRLFEREKFERVINLAAQAGVRYSIENPFAYVDSNLVGFINVLECCRHNHVQHLIYASSSSVYGANDKVPFSEDDRVDNPVSLYAATKKANELMASCYSKLYGIPATGLRFFTVYGPWGRPDMAPMLFAKAIMNGEPIKVFNSGDLSRDFTYIDDVVDGLTRVLDKIPEINKDRQHDVYNIGSSSPVKLMDFIECLEKAIGKEAEKIFLPMQPGDVYQTYANTSRLEREVGYRSCVTLKEGVDEFVTWWKRCRDFL